MVWVSKKLGKDYMRNESKLGYAALILAVLYYAIVYQEKILGVEFEGIERFIARATMGMLLPTAYLYMCDKTHMKKATISTLGIYLIILLNLFDNMVVYLDGLKVEHIEYASGIQFFRHHKQLFVMDIHDLVEVIQCIWISVRAIILFIRVKENHLKLSKSATFVFGVYAWILTTHFAESFIPNQTMDKGIMLTIYFIIHLTNIILIIYIIGMGYVQKLITDKNEEPVYMEIKPKFESFKGKIDILMEKDKIYTNKNMSVELMAGILGTNRTYLSQMIKECYGTNFVAFISTQRIEEAKRLMKTNKYSKLEDIADLCGFNSASTFTKTFKAITGVTPKAWKG